MSSTSATTTFPGGRRSTSWAAASSRASRAHTRPTLIKERRVEAGGSIIADRVIRLAGRLAGSRRNPLDRPLREVHVRIDTGKILRLVSNDLEAPAAGDRRALQDALADRAVLPLGQADPQDPPLPRHSHNAVRAQIAVALIAYLLLRMAHAAQSNVTSILTFARLVRANLMHFRTIDQLADPPPTKRLSGPAGFASVLSRTAVGLSRDTALRKLRSKLMDGSRAQGRG